MGYAFLSAFCKWEIFIIDNKVKKFIEKNIDLIEDNKWKEVYNEASEPLTFVGVGELTSTLLEADIDPLDYLGYIPSGYLCN